MTVPNWIIWGALAVAGLYILVLLTGSIFIWIRAFHSVADVKFFDIFAMRFRKTDPSLIVDNLILLKDNEIIDIDLADLENHHLGGGNVDNVVLAIIHASKSNLVLDWKAVTAYDFAGRDIFQIVTSAIQSGNLNELEPLLK